MRRRRSKKHIPNGEQGENQKYLGKTKEKYKKKSEIQRKGNWEHPFFADLCRCRACCWKNDKNKNVIDWQTMMRPRGTKPWS
jgi:hypothetical protein